MTKYIKTCMELSHPGCLLLQFYALNRVFNHIYAGIIAYGFKSFINICLVCKAITHGRHIYLSIDCLTLVCFTDLHVHLLESEFFQVGINSKGKLTGSFRLNPCITSYVV